MIYPLYLLIKSRIDTKPWKRAHLQAAYKTCMYEGINVRPAYLRAQFGTIF